MTLEPSDRRVVRAVVTEGMAWHYVREGWEGRRRGDGYSFIWRRFGSSAELREALDMFGEGKITAWVE